MAARTAAIKEVMRDAARDAAAAELIRQDPTRGGEGDDRAGEEELRSDVRMQ